MSSNSSADSSSDSGDTSSLQEIFISFVALSLLFVFLSLIRCFLQRTAIRSAALFEKRNTHGLDSTAIAALPTFPYRRGGDKNNSGGDNNGSSIECSICLSSLEEGEMVKLLPQCMHSYHSNCVELWLRGHTTCPVCRVEVLGPASAVDPPSRVEMVALPDLERQS